MDFSSLLGRVLDRRVAVGVVAMTGLSLGCGNSASRPTQPTTPEVLAVAFVAPNAGPVAVATALHIGGAGFQLGATLTLDGVVTPATFVNSSVLTSTAPPHAAGPIDLVVTNPDGRSSRLVRGYTYVLPTTSLAISGKTVLNAAGETSQLTATGTYSDGTTEDITTHVLWSSTNPTIATISAGGLLTARAIGVVTIQAVYEPIGATASLTRFVSVAITPPGTLILTGRVREPGVGSLSGVRVFHAASGQEVLTSAFGQYLFNGLTSRRLSFTKSGYEGVDLDGTPNTSEDVPLQRIIRLDAGTSISPTLAPNDMDYLVTPTIHCQPCRLIRVTNTAAGVVRVRVTWAVPSTVLNVWVNGQVFVGSAPAREVVADIPVTAGEVVLYVGKVLAAVGDYVPFTLTTARIGPP